MKWPCTPLLFLGMAACVDEPIRDCDGIEQEVVAMEQGLLKITGARETSRSPKDLVCHGTAIYKNNVEIEMRYRVYIDEDGEEMIAYDTDEADAAREAAEQRQAEQQMKAAVDDAIQDFDPHMRDNLPPGAWDRMRNGGGPTSY
ncbi:hypothetical protein VHN57_15140 [Sphingobium sp. WW5]|uniref:Lipoprotein n=1 Tax=Sphingobium yanoikuyae TaxID=13690 RepID=A0A6M4G1T1_SPHYA|nr:hypothetical protein [Sphingobium yanoikuyae]QJR01039.1 hypothetical protein HH800_01800 [Sphingobium yanoikuyae]